MRAVSKPHAARRSGTASAPSVGEGGAQRARVPVCDIDRGAVDREGDADHPNEASSSAGSSRPPRKLSPVSTAVTITSAGLNSIGSIA